MPRKLPWLVEAAKEKESKKAHSSSSPSPKRRRDSSPDDLVDLDLNPVVAETRKRREKKKSARTPSTSPPPAPPDVEYMREGYHADDIYMMVEDEFLSTAKTFTQHLHHAEYVRFKKLAKSRGANILEAIQRPVDGTMEQSNGLRMQLEAEEKAKKIKSAMKGGEDESSAEEDEYMQDPQLAGLMTGAKNTKKDLSGISKQRLDTRAAAGFSQSPRNIERTKDVSVENNEITPAPTFSKARRVFGEEVYSDTEDDLDAVPCRSTRPSYAKTEKRPSVFKEFGKDRTETKDVTESKGSNPFQRCARTPEDTRLGQTLENDGDSLAFQRRERKPTLTSPKVEAASTNAKSTAASEYLAKRRAERQKKEREDKRKTKTAIDVPTFAI